MRWETAVSDRDVPTEKTGAEVWMKWQPGHLGTWGCSKDWGQQAQAFERGMG